MGLEYITLWEETSKIRLKGTPPVDLGNNEPGDGHGWQQGCAGDDRFDHGDGAQGLQPEAAQDHPGERSGEEIQAQVKQVEQYHDRQGRGT